MISIRASELDRILSCPGSITLCAMVDPRIGDEGFEGVMLHWMIAERCIHELGATPPDGGLPPPDVPKGYQLPKNSVWIVDWAFRHVVETIPQDWAILVELPLAYTYDRWTNSGHIDIVGISPDGTESIGIDWKTGRDPVDPAENNDQVASYLGLKKRAWPTLKKGTFQIAQPRADEESGFERVSTVVVEDLDALISSIDRRVNAALDNAMELNTGIKQCRWCIGCSCPAIRELMKLKLNPEIVASIKRQPDDALLGDFVVASRILAKPIKDAQEMLHERLDKASEVVAGDGTQITRKTQRGSHYEVLDPIAFMAKTRALLPAEESIARTFTPSMTRIKDEIAAVKGVPKTSSVGVSAESIYDLELRPLVKQGETRILQFR